MYGKPTYDPPIFLWVNDNKKSVYIFIRNNSLLYFYLWIFAKIIKSSVNLSGNERVIKVMVYKLHNRF